MVKRQIESSIKTAAIAMVKPVASILKRLPLSSKIIGPPKDFWVANKDYHFNCIDGNGCHQKSKYYQIYPSHSSHRILPKLTDRQFHCKFQRAIEHKHRETFVNVISGGRVFSQSAMVISPDDKLILETSKDFNVKADKKKALSHRAFRYLKLPCVRRIDGSVAILSTMGSNNYFHWMTEALPRFKLIEESPIDIDSIEKFVVNDSLPAIHETISLLGLPTHKLIYCHPHMHIESAELIVPSLPDIASQTPQWVCQFLRDKFLSAANNTISGTEKIYISRDKARARNVVNESELINLLENHGFRTVYLEDLSFLEQVSLFSSARFIVSPHGAGLTNLIFCRPRTKVLELFSPRYVSLVFWFISNHINLEYHYFIGGHRRRTEELEEWKRDDNIYVDLNEFSDVVKILDL